MKKPNHIPPRISIWLIHRLCKPEIAEELEGNLFQFYAENQGKWQWLSYWHQVICYLRPSTLKGLSLKNSKPMFLFDPLLTLRNLAKHRVTTAINIFGFTLGLVCAFFLYFYLWDELTNDDFHVKKEQIYRAIRVSDLNGTPYNIGVTSGPYAAALQNDFPNAVANTMRVQPENALVSYGDKKFNEQQLVFADPQFFEFFSFPLLVGDPETVLKNANSVVISSEMANKYFGEDDPLGEILELDNEFPFQVTGVLAEPPSNSHLAFDMVLTISFYDRYSWFDDWWNNGLMTYVQIPTPAMADQIEGQLSGFMEKYFGEDFERSGTRMSLALEPLEDIYFNNSTRYDWARHGNFQTVMILMVVGIAILFIACFNYVNLSIAQSFLRVKEVGVRKVLGVSRKRLTAQFLGESLMVLMIATLFSVGIAEALNPAFNAYFGLEFELQWTSSSFWLLLTMMVVIILLVAGLYPSSHLSAISPVVAMRGGKISSGKSAIRKVLVTSQFAISIFLIVATLLISAQQHYLNNKDLGFDREAVILVNIDNREIRSNRQTFKERLLSNANIQSVSHLSGEPGGFHDTSGFLIEGINESNRMRTLFTDQDFIDLFGLNVLEGRGFDRNVDSDTARVMLINQKALDEIGLSAEAIIGRSADMPTWGITDLKVIGVIEDYHFSTLKDEIEPLAIMLNPYSRKMAIKVNATTLNNSLMFIDEIYRDLSPGFPMTYQFLDDQLETLYLDEQKQARVFTVFSMISIFLACLGIFGLAAYAARLRQKELGIRKVLGATPSQIIRLISADFVRMVCIGGLVAIPGVWYFINDWLNAFAHRIHLSDHWGQFAIGLILAILISLLTVSLKTYQAAGKNPVHSIRH
ncbi:MAG: FtsX-like permease family protein [Cytophagales bacterium]|nr:FtsX-like permease family protein [Cytophagales bacterium]